MTGNQFTDMDSRVLNKTDQKILSLIDILKSSGKIRFDNDFCEPIGLAKQTLRNIKLGKQHFTTNHIYHIIRVFKVNANWIFDVSDKIFIDSFYGESSEKSKATEEISR